MKVKKGVKILGAVLGAAAISMTVICCYAPGDYIVEYIPDRVDNSDDYIEQIAKEDSQIGVTFRETEDNREYKTDSE